MHTLYKISKLMVNFLVSTWKLLYGSLEPHSLYNECFGVNLISICSRMLLDMLRSEEYNFYHIY